MKRVVLVLASIACITGVAACSSGSGTHTQSLSPTSSSLAQTTSSTTAPRTDPTTSTEPTTSPSRTHTASSPSTISPPSVVPAAQSAVNAYIGLYNITSTLGLDPLHADSSRIAPYVTAATLPQWKQIFSTMAKQGLAYRGIPDNPHLKVVNTSAQSVILSSCPTPNPTNPYVQYVVATGKPVRVTTSSALHPRAITVLFNTGHWRVASVIPDEGRTCTP